MSGKWSQSKFLNLFAFFFRAENFFFSHLQNLQCKHLQRFVHLHIDFNHFHSLLMFIITPPFAVVYYLIFIKELTLVLCFFK